MATWTAVTMTTWAAKAAWTTVTAAWTAWTALRTTLATWTTKTAWTTLAWTAKVTATGAWTTLATWTTVVTAEHVTTATALVVLVALVHVLKLVGTNGTDNGTADLAQSGVVAAHLASSVATSKTTTNSGQKTSVALFTSQLLVTLGLVVVVGSFALLALRVEIVSRHCKM